MRNLAPLVLAAALCLLPEFGFAGTPTQVVTFGPLVPSPVQLFIPPIYGSLSWPGIDAWYAQNSILYDEAYGNTYLAPSGGAAFIGAGGGNGYVTSVSPFTFLGAEFSAYANFNSFTAVSATSITVTGYNAEGQLVGRISANLSASGFTFLSADLPNVTKLEFTGSGAPDGHNNWVMDDLTYIPDATLPTSTPPIAKCGATYIAVEVKLLVDRI